MQKKRGIIGGSTILFGIGLSRWAREHYGINGSKALAVSVIIYIIAVLIISAYITKKYLEVMMLFLLVLPIIIGLIGACLNNIYMMIGGLVLFFVSGVFMNKKVLPKFKDRK